MNKFITFCAIYRNEAPRIRQSLDLASKLFDNIVLGVQESDDATLQICQEYTKNIVIRPSESPEESKDYIMDRVKTPWTFWLDADEFPSLNLIREIERINPAEIHAHDAVSYIRINYINGIIVEGGQGIDRQYRMIRSHIRWEPKRQGRRIHIHPLVNLPLQSNLVIYHHRTLDKIVATTKRWNELESKTEEACNEYVKKVKIELKEKTK